MTLVDIKNNFKKQAQNWRENWNILVKVDSQKLLPLKWGCKFELKEQAEPKVNPRHLAYYILLWIACVDNYCNQHYVLKAKHSKYPKRTKWNSNEKSFKMLKWCINGTQLQIRI